MSKIRIQIVEDEGIIAEDTHQTLLKMGYDVTSISSTGADAIKNAETDKPDLILMDIVIHGDMDGIETANYIRSRHNIPVIYLTAYTDETTLERAKITEPYGYIVKPYTERELQPAIEMAIWKIKMESRLKHLNSVLRAVRSVSQLITKEKDRNKLIQGVCDNLIETRGYFNVWVLILDRSNKFETAAEAGIGSSFLRLVDQMKEGYLPDCCSRALSYKEIVTLNDSFQACTDCPLSCQFTNDGVMITRLKHNNTVYGLLSVSIPKELVNDIEEKSLFEEIGEDVAFALQNIESEKKRKDMEEELFKYHNHLESLVKERTNELTEALQLAENASRLASIGVLAGGITHEINQPLTAMKFSVDSILYLIKKNQVIQPEKLTEKLINISDAANRINKIIEHMRLHWMSPDKVIKERIDLKYTIKKGISLVERQLNSHEIELEIQCDNDPVYIYGNSIHIEQISINLIVNAMHSLDEIHKEIKKWIQLVIRKVDGFALFEVHDNGYGFPGGTGDFLFDPFYSTKKTKSGSGLGLAIVKRFVDEHQGTIKVFNNEKGGASFSLQFPVSEKTEGKNP